MNNFVSMLLSYALIWLGITLICRIQLKQIKLSLDKYFQDKFNGLEIKDTFIEEELKTRLDIVCKAERRSKNDQINLILDEWLTQYEENHK